MGRVFFETLAAVVLLAFSLPVVAGTITISGNIDGSEPVFDNPDTAATTLTPFDIYEITVAETGFYHLLSFYEGDPDAGLHLDGMLSIYESFPGSSILFDDDYTAGEVDALSDFDAQCTGSNCSGFSAMLVAGVTYTIVQTSFTDTANSFGQPTGEYTITMTGPGVFAFPLPAAAWLMLSGLASLGLLRRF